MSAALQKKGGYFNKDQETIGEQKQESHITDQICAAA